MKKKGFTLIELLAVIVILAIIALIAIPVITNVIEKAKKGAAESSALGYLSAVENQVAINAVDTSKEDIVDGEYEVSILASKGVSVKGNEPKSGTVTITKGQVTACSLVIDKYTIWFKEALIHFHHLFLPDSEEVEFILISRLFLRP